MLYFICAVSNKHRVCSIPSQVDAYCCGNENGSLVMLASLIVDYYALVCYFIIVLSSGIC